MAILTVVYIATLKTGPTSQAFLIRAAFDMNPFSHFYVVKSPGALHICKAICPPHILCATPEVRISTPGLTALTGTL
jgi:hypothetical protein